MIPKNGHRFFGYHAQANCWNRGRTRVYSHKRQNASYHHGRFPGRAGTPKISAAFRCRRAFPAQPIASSISTAWLATWQDCGFDRQGMSRLHAFYKKVALAHDTNIVRKKPSLPEAHIPATDPKLSLVPLS
jgi:hypothetical protein